MNDLYGNALYFDDTVVCVVKNRIVIGVIIDFTPKKIRIKFDPVKFSHAVSFTYTYGTKKDQIPTVYKNADEVVKYNSP